MSRANQWFLPGDGIAREVITADIQRYLGPDALVRPGPGTGDHEGRSGYWITSFRTLSSQMIQDMKLDSQRWQQEQGPQDYGRGVAYQDSRTHAARQHWGPSQVRESNHNSSMSYSSLPRPNSATPKSRATHGYYTASDGRQYPLPFSGMQVSHSLRRLQTRSDEDDSSWVYLAQPQRQFTSPLSNIHETNVQAFEYNEPQDKNGIVRPSTTQNLNQSQDLSQLGLSPGSVAFSDAEYIHQSYEGLDTVTQLMNRSLDEISRLCHWKTGPQNFSEKPADVELISLKLLGKGSDGEVDEVRVSGNFDDAEHFVRKAISIRWGEQEAKMNKLAIKREVENLKKVSVHPHIVKIIGWYQETTKWGREFAFLLTYPVGEGNLDRFFQTVKKARLKGLHEQTAIYRLWLKKWFYCLASALAFMHANNLHHKDIKPLNVIHRGDCIYFTDFGSSRSFENGQSTCTESYAKATMLFAAPEAWQNDDEYKPRHGSKADVFSLGLLFMEMMTTLFDGDIDELRDFVFGNGYGKRQYCHVTNRFEGWFKNRMERGNFNTYIKPMLADHKDDRPSAEEVKMNIWGNCMWGEVMACPCKDSQNE